MSRHRLVLLLLLAAGLLPAAARADFGASLQRTTVPLDREIRGVASGSALPLYLVPVEAAPEPFRCRGSAICAPRSRRAPGEPFVFLGRLRTTGNPYARQRFSFPLPAQLRPGRYRLFLWCERCGGSLIAAGATLSGQTLTVTASSYSRVVRLARGRQLLRFRMRHGAGVARLVRLTAPRGAAIRVTARIPIAGVSAQTGDPACRRIGTRSVCEPGIEWCPLPEATWTITVAKSSLAPATVRFDFWVAPPPGQR